MRRLESVNQIGHPRKTNLRVGLVLEKCASLLQGARYKLQLPVGSIASVGVAGHEMALDGIQHVPEILGVRPVVALLEPQLQRLSCGLHEVHELVGFQQRDERVQQAEQVAVNQTDQSRSTRRHVREIA